jgi:hypothetical protein
MINIADILKDCPKGTKLYSPLFGDCMFREIDNSSNFKIVVEIENGEPKTFDDFGRYFSGFQNSECMLFSSKDNRDWNTFRPFKDGDIIAKDEFIVIFSHSKRSEVKVNEQVVYYHCYLGGSRGFKSAKGSGVGYISDFRFATDEEKQKLFDAIKANGYKWNAETKTLEKLIVPKFKVGDEIVRKNGISNSFIVNSVSSDYYGLVLPDRTGVGVLNVSEQDDWELVLPIHKFKVGDKIVKKDNPTECWYVQGVNTNCNSDYFYYIVAKGQLANLHFKEQDDWELAPVPKFKVGDIVKSNRNTLFDYKIIKITDIYYTLESIPGANTYDMFICEDENWKLVPNKFDISTLKAYDKVLVRDGNDEVWVNAFFGFCDNVTYKACIFVTGNENWCQCIPYEGNEHLLGTNNDCDEYYKNW